MATVTRDQVMDRLRTVKDPELHKDLVTLNMVKSVAVDGQTVSVHIELTTPACPLKDQIRNDVTKAITSLSGVGKVDIEWSAQVRSSRGPTNQLPGVKNIVAVGAGKGGVGKSTAAVMLAYGLHRMGASVGLMDADVYGPSIPTLTGLVGTRPEINGTNLVPPTAGGVKVMSVGFLVEPDKPLVMRGPMLHGIVRQFLEQVEWGELDYLVIDLPPGTGDVPLSLAQAIPMTGAIIICTPQDVALIDARRAVRMFEQLNVPCLGIIENMSYYLCPKCGNRDELFDHGGANQTAQEMRVPFLGEIPLNAKVRAFGDAGAPEKLFTDTADYVNSAILKVVSNAAGQISVRSRLQTLAPTLSVE